MRVFFSSTLLITGVTIGAGMFGLPYVFAPMHRLVAGGIIVFFGFIMLIVNLMVGEVSYAFKKSLQLPGLAGVVVHARLQKILLLIVILSWLGALVAYMVGEGDVLAGLFGGSARLWSYGFWAIASAVVISGFSVVKKTVQIASVGVIGLLLGLSGYALFHQQPTVVASEQQTVSFWQLVPTFGVALFALHGAPAIAQAHELLKRSYRHFRIAVVVGTLLPIAVCVFFTLAVVGVTGLSTTPVATIGLGNHLGSGVRILGALCAVLAMFSCYCGIGTALYESLVWDVRSSPWWARFLVVAIPSIIFSVGVKNFTRVMGSIGGILIAGEILIMLYVYARAIEQRILVRQGFVSAHPRLLVLPIAALVVVGALSSFVLLFR